MNVTDLDRLWAIIKELKWNTEQAICIISNQPDVFHVELPILNESRNNRGWISLYMSRILGNIDDIEIEALKWNDQRSNLEVLCAENVVLKRTFLEEKRRTSSLYHSLNLEIVKQVSQNSELKDLRLKLKLLQKEHRKLHVQLENTTLALQKQYSLYKDNFLSKSETGSSSKRSKFNQSLHKSADRIIRSLDLSSNKIPNVVADKSKLSVFNEKLTSTSSQDVSLESVIEPICYWPDLDDLGSLLPLTNGSSNDMKQHSTISSLPVIPILKDNTDTLHTTSMRQNSSTTNKIEDHLVDQILVSSSLSPAASSSNYSNSLELHKTTIVESPSQTNKGKRKFEESTTNASHGYNIWSPTAAHMGERICRSNGVAVRKTYSNDSYKETATNIRSTPISTSSEVKQQNTSNRTQIRSAVRSIDKYRDNDVSSSPLQRQRMNGSFSPHSVSKNGNEVFASPNNKLGIRSPTSSSSASKISLVGMNIRKSFDGSWYNGTVIQYNAPYYKVTYTDGDSEELSESEVRKYAVTSMIATPVAMSSGNVSR